ncbi:protein patched homolog 2 isoform X3 [Diceros bicornis minor]|uniref:protein patched homolog 2 isoform X3 n=1 Tax=Diceros bicornis minor TaxID=77932 RepID=UPI0026EA7561|nr:protein patched homolog 2 isoform X3 [Diceros bicornis minor]
MARPPLLRELPPGYAPPARSAAPQIPLWLRAYFQSLLFSLGCGIQRHCGKVLFLGLLAFGALALGLRVAIIETDLEQLWVEVGSRVSQELHYTKEKLGEEAAYTSQMLIQTPRQEGENVLTPEALGLHLLAALTASKVQVSLYGKSWDLNKICYKSGVPLIENGMIERMIEKLFPCVILTPLDCFWEGAKLQGGSAYLPGRPDIQWTNLDPEQLLEELGPFASLEGFRELLDKAQVGQAYMGRPCLHPDDLHCPPSAPNHHSRQAPNVAQELSGGCHGFSHKFMHWQEELLLGGMARDPQGQLLRAEALQSTFLLMSPHQLYEHFRGDYQTHDIGWSEEQAGTVLQAWQRRFVQLAQEALPENASQQIHAFSSTTLDDILHTFSEVSAARLVGGYLLMLAYACVTMLRWDCAQSQGAVGLAGVLLVALAVASGLGLCALLGITFNAATTQVLPFLALGIGVDDIFLLAHAFTEAPPGTPFQERTGECLQRTGTSVALTSINNMVAFFMAALVPIPALRAFSLQAAVVVGCNFVAVMLVFPAVLSLDLHRRHCQRLDVLCCFSSPCSARVIQILPQELEDRTVPVAIAHLTATVQAFAHCEASSQHVVTILPPQAHLVPPPSDPLGSELFSPGGSTRDLLGQEGGTRQKAACKSLPCVRWNLAHFARYHFAPLLLQSHTKAMVLVLFGALLGLSLYGATLVQDGLALTDVVPRGTKEHAFLSAQLRYFSLYEVALVTQGGFDYAHSQSALFDLHQRFSSLKAVLPPPATQAPRTWLHYYRNWLQGIQAAFDQDWASGRITHHSYRNGSEDGALAYKLLIQTGDSQEPLDFSQLTTRKLVDKEGLIPPELFYLGLTVWVSSDPLGLAASQANFYPPPPEWLHDKYDTTGENLRSESRGSPARASAWAHTGPTLRPCPLLPVLTAPCAHWPPLPLPAAPSHLVPAAQPLEFAQFPFLLHGLQKTADFVEAIEGARAACAEAGQAGVRAYPSGSPFLFWEQYLGLRRCFLLAVCILLMCTFLVCALLLLNPWTAGLIVLILAMMTIELFGIMGFLDIKLSAIPVVILVASVGIGVEFTVHMALGFLTTQGGRNLRAAHALEHTFAPVTDGAVSTLLGLLMLAGSNFDFIVRYFFMVLTVLTLLGLLHGLVLLPVLLSILGPPPEVTTPSLCSQPREQGGTGKGRDRNALSANRQGSADEDPPHEAPPTEGGSLPLCPDTMSLSLSPPGFFMGSTLAFWGPKQGTGLPQASLSCPLSALISRWRPARTPASPRS